MSTEAVQNFRCGYLRDDPRKSKRAQRAMLEADGIERFYDNWDLLMRQRRKGRFDVIVVTDYFLVADETQRTIKGGLRRSLLVRTRAVHKLEASIFELGTGRSTRDEDERLAMLSDALDVLAYSRNRSTAIGRPAVAWSDAERMVARMHWKSREHSNDTKARDAIKAAGIKGAYNQRLRDEFGPSGRKPGTEGPRPTRRKKKKR